MVTEEFMLAETREIAAIIFFIVHFIAICLLRFKSLSCRREALR